MPTWRLSFVIVNKFEEFLFGVGWNRFDELRKTLLLPSPHNYFIESFISGGILGVMPLAVSVLILIYFFARAARAKRDVTEPLLFGAVFLIMFFMNIWYIKGFWLLLSIFLASFSYYFEKKYKGS